ncbi:hypothetical protein BACCOP_03428 [Phocaeicola coprocola DSM 17136]|uniref:Uncharacterized protein n=1 Tax=Phocaeicola coprocola DSM 17136 TaxID=470145 RepID=B3JNB6_9BACT|nr:hypothetical protein BACCOP_03428 [Phocaeicola coprocola DSM 17136]
MDIPFGDFLLFFALIISCLRGLGPAFEKVYVLFPKISRYFREKMLKNLYFFEGMLLRLCCCFSFVIKNLRGSVFFRFRMSSG